MSLPRHRVLASIAACLKCISLLLLPVSGRTQDASPVASSTTGEETAAIIVSATNNPLRVTGSAGVDHVEYDLLVTNGFSAPITLASVIARAPDGEPLLEIDGDALVAATQPLLGRTSMSEIPASGTAAVVVNVPSLRIVNWTG